MITPQDIREKTFEKAMFGGYDMGGIDEFLEEVANDLAVLQKENAVLKGKMKVLVDKVDEYRKNEDSLGSAVISAQRLGAMIEAEAREKAAAIVAEAEAKALEIATAAAVQVEAEERRLADAKRASAKFLEGMNLICSKQAAFLKKISETDYAQQAMAAAAPVVVEAPAAPAAPVVEEAPVEMHETVKSIEETVSKVADVPEQTIVPDIAAPQPAFHDAVPTRAFDRVSNETVQFSFDSFDDLD